MPYVDRPHTVNPLERIRVEKAAADCGFDLPPRMVDGGLELSSAQFPETVTVQALGNGHFSLLASSPVLFSQMAAVGAESLVESWDGLYEALEIVSAAARTMPNRVAEKFRKVTAEMPKSTEAERWVVQRVGQNIFRGALLDYWRGACCVTALAIPELLRASHIKPWALCASDEERLDVFNGLLLAPHLDALFDGGWMTFDPNGQGIFSSQLTAMALEQMGVPQELVLAGLTKQHQTYLEFHRNFIFKRLGR